MSSTLNDAGMPEAEIIRRIQGYAHALGNGDMSLSQFYAAMRQMEKTPITQPQKLAPVIEMAPMHGATNPRRWTPLNKGDK